MGCGGSAAKKKKAVLAPADEGKLKELFKNMDEDEGGTVTKEEAQKFFKGKFGKVSAIAMFNEVDSDNNGQISEAEFLGFWRQVVASGYTPEEVMEEVEEIMQGGTWVDWKDGRSTGK